MFTFLRTLMDMEMPEIKHGIQLEMQFEMQKCSQSVSTMGQHLWLQFSAKLSVGWEKEERIGPIVVLKKNKRPLSAPDSIQGPAPVLAGELSSRLLLGGWCFD